MRLKLFLILFFHKTIYLFPDISNTLLAGFYFDNLIGKYYIFVRDKIKLE